VSTPNKAAKLAHLSRGGVNLILEGITKAPTVQTIDQLADALGTTRDYLLYGREATEKQPSNLAALKGILNEQRDMLLRQAEAAVRGEARQLFWDSWDELESAVLDEIDREPRQPPSTSIHKALDRVRASVEGKLRNDQSDDGSSHQQSA
jgi:transcriptional regulator with XRE-family HTH domain